MEFLTLFYAPMLVAARWPAAPFLLAALFALAQLALMKRHHWPYRILMWRRPALFACALWLVYGLYELQVQATWHTGNLRIDLLVLTPILYVFSATAGWWIHRCWQDPRHASVADPAPAPESASDAMAQGGSETDSRARDDR